jgi:16S rRNA (adenine1518-N6/adenine1519-N6)-dimethyltransferase
MMEFSYETRISVWMNKYHFRFDRNLGQNFLINEAVLDRIVAGAAPSKAEKALEIGPGMGFLTEKLAAAFGSVTAVELDATLCEILTDQFSAADNVRVVHGDALRLDIAALASETAAAGFPGPFKIVANLPYYITTPLLFSFLERREHWSEMVIMVQKEVAERVVAAPGGKDCGVLTLMSAFDADPEILFTVPAADFYPRPAVDSAVLRLTKREHPPCFVADKKIFRAVVKAAFGQRRKTLSNALKNSGLFAEKNGAAALLEACGIDGRRRGETLSFAEFAALANAYVSAADGGGTDD